MPIWVWVTERTSVHLVLWLGQHRPHHTLTTLATRQGTLQPRLLGPYSDPWCTSICAVSSLVRDSRCVWLSGWSACFAVAPKIYTPIHHHLLL